MSNTTQLSFGPDNLPARPVLLRAGPLTAWFEPQTLFLRRISYQETEIVQAIYGAVRDRGWGTVPPKVGRCLIQNRENAFQIEFTAMCSAGEINYLWHGSIEGSEDGQIRYCFQGVAQSAFLTNRIGPCVLHPIKGCSGQECRVEHVDGSIETGVFPQFISPHQPFKSIRSITHSVAGRISVSIQVEGDIFEMEDQRNWTDASFKTYSRPLEQPFPFQIKDGERIQQSVTITLTEMAEVSEVFEKPAALQVRVPTDPGIPRPALGLCFSSLTSISELGCERLRALQLDHLRVDLHLARGDWTYELEEVLKLLSRLSPCRLHCALFLGDAPESQLHAFSHKLLSIIADRHPSDIIALWLIYSETSPVLPDNTIQLAQGILRAITSNIPIAAGTNANFAELNRNRPTANVMPCFSCNPQVHVTDDLSLFENLQALPDTVATCRQFSSNPVVISPITLRPRGKAVAAAPGIQKRLGISSPQADPRQTSLLGAAWTLGSLARLISDPAVHSLTYFEVAGPLGIMADQPTPPSGTELQSRDFVFPVYHLFAWLAGSSESSPVMVSDPERIAAISLSTSAGNKLLLLANLTADDQAIKVHALFKSGTWKALDGESLNGAKTAPEDFQSREGRRIDAGSDGFSITLGAYSVGLLSGNCS